MRRLACQRICGAIVAIALGPTVALPAAGQDNAKIDAQSARFFESQVRPLLANRCFSCHGPEQQKGKLRLDSLAGTLKGGRTGPAIQPGRPESSLLVRAIQHGEELQMPPKSKLPKKEIDLLTAWVKMGAPWPQAEPIQLIGKSDDGPKFTKQQLEYWSFRAPVVPRLPAVRTEGWIRNPIDRFILGKLEEKGLSPAPPADRRTLIRRATFDLIGLPPTREEIEDFLQDRAPDAFARVVERLLASPRYGVRWGRHWLDVARYSDSNGMDENLAFGNAYRYRDWVIAAFNNDMPYDDFVRQQIAGDLLPTGEPRGVSPRVSTGDDPGRIIATGFLSIGPKMLAEDDPVKMEMDIIDEQVDTLGRTLMGLTLGCARCHDHKFDPISMADYYGLAGIFKSTKTMDSFNVVARWHERSIGSKIEQDRARQHAEEANRKREAIQKLKADPKSAEKLKALRGELAKFEKTRPITPEAMAIRDGAATNLRIHLRGSHLNLGTEAPRRVPAALAGKETWAIADKQSGRLELARWLTRPEHPLTSRVMVNRIWLQHFGVGLVRSPDNFGLLGDRPVHRELLDWLAVKFIDSGWSIKAMHRLIMLSNTYQISGAYRDTYQQIDPENRLHWRMNRRRLEAEAVRDSILAVSGRLDQAMGGSLLQTSNRAYVASTFSVNPTNYESRRRSVYLPVVRSALYEVFQAFDFADPSVANGERGTTTVAPQALFMMNSDLVETESRHFAESLLREQKRSDAERIRVGYEKALGRQPTAAEVQRALAFVRQVEQALPAKLNTEERRLRAWSSLCRVVLASNEFIYVE